MRSLQSLRVQLNAKTTFGLNTTCCKQQNTLVPFNYHLKSSRNFSKTNLELKSTTQSTRRLLNSKKDNNSLNTDQLFLTTSRTMSTSNQYVLTTGDLIYFF